MKNRSVAVTLALLLAVVRPARGDDGVTVCADKTERAQELRDATKLVEARELLVACAQKECPTTVRDACAERLAEVDRRVPSIVVNARDASGQDIAGVRAFLDGSRLPDTIGFTAARVNPGQYAIRYEADGFAPVDGRIVLREGEGVRVLAVTFRRPPERAERPRTDPWRAGGPRPTLLTYVLGGTAVASLGLFTVVGLMGASEYRRLERECAPKCAASELEDVRAKFLIADVGLLVGFVTAGAAVASALFAPTPEPSRPRPRSAER